MQLLDRTSRLNLDTRGINPTTVHQLFEYHVLVIQLSSGRLLFLELIVNVPSSLWDRRSGRPPPECVGIWWVGKETISPTGASTSVSYLTSSFPFFAYTIDDNCPQDIVSAELDSSRIHCVQYEGVKLLYLYTDWWDLVGQSVDVKSEWSDFLHIPFN